MIPATQVQTTFVGGEVSTALAARFDIERYASSGSLMENFLPTVEGPMTKRTGTQVIPNNGAFPAANGRLVAFNSRTFSCTLLFNGTYAIVWGHSNPSESVSTSVPYSLGQLPYLIIKQVNDVLFITHPEHPPARLARYGVGTWAYEVLPLTSGPYMDFNPDELGISLKLNITSDRINLVSTTTDFTGRVEGDYVEYSTGAATALGIVRTVTSSSAVSIEPLQERCFSLSKETYALGQFMGYGSLGVAPYNLANAANYQLPHSPSTYQTQNVIQIGGYYRISSVGDTDFTAYGASANTVGVGFFANQTLSPYAGTGMVINDNVGFSNTQVITNNHTANYLQYADIKGQRRWMYIRGRRDVPEQSAYGVIACGETLRINGNILPQSYAGTITQSARLIIGTLTASSDAFTATDVGRWFRLEFGSAVVDVKVTSVTDARNALVTATRPVPVSGYGEERIMNSTTTTWRRGSFYVGNYPRTSVFHEGRLGFGGTYTEPQTFWLSKSGDHYNFSPSEPDLSVADDSAITGTIASDVYQEIRDMISRTTLSLLTSFAEWVVTSGQNRDPLTPRNITARRESSYGSDLVQAIQSGRSTLFVQENGLRIRELTYDYSVDGNIPLDVTVFSGHIFRQLGRVKELHYLRRPVPTVFAVTLNGQLALMVYEPDQKVYAWSRVSIGGSGSPTIVSACVLHSGNATGEDMIWLLVQRGGVYSIERMHVSFNPSSAQDTTYSYHHMDSAVSMALPSAEPDGTCTIDLTLYTWLQNSTLCALVDNQIYLGLTSDANEVVLPVTPLSRLWIGFAYTASYQTLPIHFDSRTGHSHGHTRQLSEAIFRIKDSLDFSYAVVSEGATLGNAYAVRDMTDPVDRIPYLRSTDVKVQLGRIFGVSPCLLIQSDGPYPLTVQSISYNLTQTN